MKGVFVLGTAVYECAGRVYFGDMCYAETIRHCEPQLSEVCVVARCRSVKTVGANWPSFLDVGADLILKLPDFGQGRVRRWIRLLRCIGLQDRLRQIMEASDFVYVENACVESFLGARAAARAGRMVMLEMRSEGGMAQGYMRARFGLFGRPYSWIFRRLFAYVLKNSDSGLYLNEATMRQFPVRGAHMAAISDVRIPDELRRAPQDLGEPATKYLFVGHLEKAKKVDLILSALADARSNLPVNWLLTVAGDGPERTALEHLATRLGIRGRVHFLGNIPWGENLFRLYRQSHLLLITSLVETGPRVLLEGMAAGLAVLSTPVGLARELLGPPMLVNSWDVSVWSGALTMCVNEPSTWRAAAAQSYRQLEQFDWTSLSCRRRRFYQEAIQRGVVARRMLVKNATGVV